MTHPPLLTFNPRGAGVVADVDAILEYRLLIQGGSGSGKSTLIRNILEQTQGRAQHLVIDKEGEFITLRPRYDYLVVGKGGDTPIDPRERSIRLLVRKVMELGTNTVFDLSELAHTAQREYVKHCIDELMLVPTALQHPTFVVLSEAHFFAPESGHGASAATDSVAHLASAGRKRLFALIADTQRLSKLKKDVAAELKNKAIGFTDQIDVKRALDELDLPGDRAAALKDLARGTFYVKGPAFTRHATLVDVPMSVTSPPPRGQTRAPLPAPKEKVAAALASLADLPQRAEEEARTLEEQAKQIASLRRELTAVKRVQPVAAVPAVPDEVKIAAAVEAARARLLNDVRGVIRIELAPLAKQANALAGALDRAKSHADAIALMVPGLEERLQLPKSNGHMQRATIARRPETTNVRVAPPAPHASNDEAEPSEWLSKPQQRILDTLAAFEAVGLERVSKSNAAVFSDASPTSSSYANNLGRLRSLGLIDYPSGGEVQLTEVGRERARVSAPITSRDELHDAWYVKLPGPQRRILEVLVDSHPESVPRADLAEIVGASSTSSSYANNLGALRSLGLIDYQSGSVFATKLLFPEGLS